MTWHLRSFVASNFNAQKKFRNPVSDLLSYLVMTLTPLTKDFSKQSRELSKVAALLVQKQGPTGDMATAAPDKDGHWRPCNPAVIKHLCLSLIYSILG